MKLFQRGRKKRMTPQGQMLPVTLIVGAVLLIFALAMVSILTTTIKLGVKANSGTWSTLVADSVVDKSINILTRGNNWGSPPSLSLTPLPGFKADQVYTDVPNSQYLVQIDPGNLINPPGDLAYERTVTVDMYSIQKGVATPSVQPTPWLRGGPLPTGYTNHRRVQSVVRRSSLTAAVVDGGVVNVGGHFRVFWGDIYNYNQPTPVVYPNTSVVVVDLGNEPLGPGYPSVHTKDGCIISAGSCGGCFGGSGSTSSTVCLTTDTGAVNCKLYPNDPNMPPQPQVDLQGLKAKAKAFYVPGTGLPGAGLPSKETGYFYSTTCASCAGTNSQGGGAAGAADETNHQYTGTSMDLFRGNNQLEDVLGRMAQNLGLSSSWGGNDDLVCYVDTADGLPLQNDLSNACNAGSDINIQDTGFVGTLVILGNINDHGGSNFGINTSMTPPDATWCPAALTTKVCINGFFYVGGNFSSTGSPTFYGSFDVEGDFEGNGTPTLYYRSDFKYSLIESGRMGVTKWQEVKNFPPPLP